VEVALPPPDSIMKGRDGWTYESGNYRLGWGDLVGLVSKLEQALRGRSSCVSIQSDDLAAGLLAELAVLSRTASVELVRDGTPSCPLRASLTGGPGNPSLSIAEGGAGGWNPPQGSTYLSISAHGDRRAVYSAEALWGDAVSLAAFLGVRGSSLAVVGSAAGEFELSAAALSISAADHLSYSQAGSPPGDYGAAFVGASAIASIDGKLRRGLSFVGVEGPLEAGLSRSMERSLGSPVLQMYGVSGRGILFSNSIGFNVHGSSGIPITNVEAMISEVLEASWYRGRRMLGPGEEGELAIRGPFIDIGFNAGDPRQRRIQVRVSGRNQEWLGTGIIGRMDENGYLYPGGRSFV